MDQFSSGVTRSVPEETEQEDRERSRRDRERIEAWEGMVKTKGWKLYVELLNIQINDRAGGLLEELGGGIRAVLAQEYQKGAMRGLILARDLVGVTLQNVQKPRLEDDDE